MTIPYWFETPEIIFDKKYMLDVIPKNYTMSAKTINAIVRFSIFSNILLFVLVRNVCFLFLPLFPIVFTYVWYIYETSKKKKETFDNPITSYSTKVQKKTVPTDNNPFMNFDYINDSCKKKKAPAVFVCDTEENIETRKDIESKFDIRLYKDTSDIFQRRNSQREFYTRAYQCIPDQTSFSKWCFQTGPTCKEQGLYCGQPSI
jgi:hypothetical protein